MPAEFRLCAIDLDDMLLGPDHKVSPRNAAAVAASVRKGVIVVLASGRMFASAVPSARQLDLDTPIICYNGAMVKRPRSGEIWMEECVDTGSAGRLLDLCRERGLQLNFYWNDLLYSAEMTPWLELYESRTGSPVKLLPDFYTALKGVAPTKLIIVDDPERIVQLLPEMQQLFGSALYVTRSNSEYLEFLPPKANKGAALAYVADRYGVRAEECVAFGDSWNDIPMLHWAGLSLAVANAKQEVLDAADRTIPSSAEDGVGVALEQLFDVRP